MPSSILHFFELKILQLCSIWNTRANVLRTPNHPFLLFVAHLFFFTYLTSLEKKRKRDGILKVDWYERNTAVSKNQRQYAYYWAGLSQSSVLAAPWLAQLVGKARLTRAERGWQTGLQGTRPTITIIACRTCRRCYSYRKLLQLLRMWCCCGLVSFLCSLL